MRVLKNKMLVFAISCLPFLLSSVVDAQSSGGVAVAEIRFLKNSTELADRSYFFTLKDLAQTIRDSSYDRFLIAGHASAEGSTEFNQSLSEQRAKAICDYLLRQDIPKHRVSMVGYGETKARYSDTSPEYLLATDRRVLVFRSRRYYD